MLFRNLDRELAVPFIKGASGSFAEANKKMIEDHRII